MEMIIYIRILTYHMKDWKVKTNYWFSPYVLVTAGGDIPRNQIPEVY